MVVEAAGPAPVMVLRIAALQQTAEVWMLVLLSFSSF
jgi:hypothetical protein